MSELFRINWAGFDAPTGLKVAIGLLVVLLLAALTNQPWMATGLVMLFGWITDLPGALKQRVVGITAFGLGALVLTFLFGVFGTGLRAVTLLTFFAGLLGSLLLAKGMRPYLIGYVVICWAIYGPAMIDGTSLSNVLIAIVVGTCVLVALIWAGERVFPSDRSQEPAEEKLPFTLQYVCIFSVTIAVVLGATTFAGYRHLAINPTVIAGAAFFVIGFDAHQSWIAGFGRLVGVVVGGFIGFYLASSIGAGLLLDSLTIAMAFLTFATMSMHSGALMFFLVMMGAVGWVQLEPELQNVIAAETFLGEALGIVVAMVTVVFLQWAQQQFGKPMASPVGSKDEI